MVSGEQPSNQISHWTNHLLSFILWLLSQKRDFFSPIQVKSPVGLTKKGMGIRLSHSACSLIDIDKGQSAVHITSTVLTVTILRKFEWSFHNRRPRRLVLFSDLGNATGILFDLVRSKKTLNPLLLRRKTKKISTNKVKKKKRSKQSWNLPIIYPTIRSFFSYEINS